MKRPAWDYNVNIVVRNVNLYGHPPEKLTFPISALTALGFFANCPPPEDGDLEVDLVQQGLSPYPVTADALKGIVDLLQPFALCKHRQRRLYKPAVAGPFGDWRDDRGQTPCIYELLECVDALCLDKSACQGLDDVMATFLEYERTLMYFRESDGDGWGRIDLNDIWGGEGTAKNILQLRDINDWEQDELCAKVVLPVVRWAVLQLYSKLDSIGFHRSQRALAKHMVRPGDKLLYGDAAWADQLSDFQAGGLLSDAGRGVLFKAAVSAPEASSLMPQMKDLYYSSTFDANMKDILLGQGVLLPGGIKLCHCDDPCIIMPLEFVYPDTD